jgi:AcrR family transcriptional regulator
MLTSPRILRADAQRFEPALCQLTPRQQARHDRILRVSRYLFARYSRATLTFGTLATALRIGAGTLRFHFVDLDALLACLLRTHLENIAAGLAEIPANAPDRGRKLRAAYIAATRSADGALTSDHIILLRDRALLPLDEAEPIEQLRAEIAETLAGDLGPATIAMLDMDLPPDTLDLRIQAMQEAAAAPRSFPAPRACAAPPETPLRPTEFLAFGPGGLRVAHTDPPPDPPPA